MEHRIARGGALTRKTSFSQPCATSSRGDSARDELPCFTASRAPPYGTRSTSSASSRITTTPTPTATRTAPSLRLPSYSRYRPSLPPTTRASHQRRQSLRRSPPSRRSSPSRRRLWTRLRISSCHRPCSPTRQLDPNTFLRRWMTL